MNTAHVLIAAIAAAAAVAAAVLVIWLVLRYKQVSRRLDRILRKMSAAQLKNIVIPDGIDREIHIGRLVLTHQGALVVDFIDAAGVVFAGDKLEEWAVIDKRGRHPFRNPLWMLNDRIAAVKAISPDIPVDGVIVFSDEGDFRKGRPDKVRLLHELVSEPHAAPVPHYEDAWALLARQAESA